MLMTESSEYLVETQNLMKAFNTKIAVNKINLRIKKGSIYALLGPNGAGKTTTIRMLLGLLKPSHGEIRVKEIDVVRNPKAIRGKISLLPQVSAAYHDLTSIQNIKFILELNNLSYKETRDKLNSYFVKLNITPDLLTKPFSKLSGGEQRTISFIMAIITDKDFLILDEPTSGLDIARAKYVREIIRTLVDEGKTVLLSSHIASDLEELAEYCGILRNGKLVFQDRKENLVKTFAPETNDFEDAIVTAFQTPMAEIEEVI